MTTRLSLLLVVLAAVLVAVPAAHAADLHVAPGATPKADCTNAADPCPTIAAALTQSRALAGADTIHLAAGVYDETVAVDNAADAGLTIAGAGSGDGGARIAPNAIPGATLVRVAPPASNVTLRDLRVVHLAGAPSDKNLVGVSAPGTLVERVVADVQRPASIGFAFAVNGGPVTLSRADSTGVATWNGSAVNAGPGSYDLTIADGRLRAGANQPALQLSAGVRAVVQRSVFERPNGNGVTVNAGGATLRMESSLVIGGATGVQVGSSGAANPGSGTLRNITVDAGATRGAADAGTAAVRAAASANGVATVTLGSSITVEAQQSEDFQPTADASVTCTDSDVPSQTQAKGGALGLIACGAAGGNVTSTPGALFVNAAGGDYRLAVGSPAVDTGSAEALAAEESATDLAGNPRVLDGNLDCVARRDKGAYELTGQVGCLADTVRPVVSAYSLKHTRFRPGSKTKLRFTLSEGAGVTLRIERATLGRRVDGACVRDRPSRRTHPRCRRWVRVATVNRLLPAGATSLTFPATRLSPGRHRVVITATDAAANTSKPRTLGFTIRR